MITLFDNQNQIVAYAARVCTEIHVSQGQFAVDMGMLTAKWLMLINEPMPNPMNLNESVSALFVMLTGYLVGKAKPEDITDGDLLGRLMLLYLDYVLYLVHNGEPGLERFDITLESLQNAVHVLNK